MCGSSKEKLQEVAKHRSQKYLAVILPGRLSEERKKEADAIGIGTGAYEVEMAGAPALAWVAVNVDPQESDVRPGPSLIETAAEIDPERFLVRLDLGAGLLGGALLLALLQALVAARRREDPTLDEDEDEDVDEEDRLAS